MTNRNRKIRSGQVTKKQDLNLCKKDKNEEEKGLGENILHAIIPNITSIFALVISLIALYYNVNYAKKEYEYKLDPKIITRLHVSTEAYQLNGKNEYHVYPDTIQIDILEKNNLESAYLISPDYEVKRLNVNEAENILEEDFNRNIKIQKYDFVKAGRNYQYRFLYLTGVDGSTELSLIYIKMDGDEMTFQSASGIEIWGLANSHQGDEAYAGEKVMAEQYQKILNESEKYIL